MKYYVPDHGETAKDADLIEIEGEASVLEFAEIAAQHCYDNRDGWEWRWPITMAVIDDAGAEHRITVEREDVPTFYAAYYADETPSAPTPPEGS